MIDDDKLSSIERLHKLKTDGIITEADFDKAKTDILEGPVRRTARLATTATDTVTLPVEDDYPAWMILPLKRYAEFTGRSRRKEFWLFTLFVQVVSAGLLICVAVDSGGYDGFGVFATLSMATWVLGMLAVIVPTVAVEVRRFHDQGRSGWFALLNLIPYIGPFVVLAFMLIPGTEGDNAYGPDPLA